MRPGRRLLLLAGGALALTVLMLAADVLPPQAVVLLWAALAVIAVADLALAPGARALEVALNSPDEVFAGENVRLRVRLTARHGRIPPVAGARAEAHEALGGLTRFNVAQVADDQAEGGRGAGQAHPFARGCRERRRRQRSDDHGEPRAGRGAERQRRGETVAGHLLEEAPCEPEAGADNQAHDDPRQHRLRHAYVGCHG